jgi:imidazolonepropionase
MTKPAIDLVISGAKEVFTCVPTEGNPAGWYAGMDVAIRGEKIVAIASGHSIREQYDLSHAVILNAEGKILAPGFVDCHTHLVFGGSRAKEYSARMTRSTEEVKALGIPTGIQATVSMTRDAGVETLHSNAADVIGRMLRCGTTTVESKSGYGLTTEKELDLLRVNRVLRKSQPVDIVSTFLGAHDFPKEISRQDYIDLIINEMIPAVADEGLAEFCDVYCDEGYYSAAESRLILEAGLKHGLRPKLHVDAYANIGGCAVASGLKAISADHLNYTTEIEVDALRAAGVAGVVMPGLDFAVRHPRPFNARVMLDRGLTVALATDFCPACWMESMQLVMQLACRQYQFSPEEALLASTVNAAKALGMDDRGTLEPGKLADIQLWDIPSFEDLIYRLGNNAVSAVVKRGKVVVNDEVKT